MIRMGGSTLTQHRCEGKEASERQRRRRQRRPTPLTHDATWARDAAAAGRTRLKSSARNTARSPDRRSGTALICSVRPMVGPENRIAFHATPAERWVCPRSSSAAAGNGSQTRGRRRRSRFRPFGRSAGRSVGRGKASARWRRPRTMVKRRSAAGATCAAPPPPFFTHSHTHVGHTPYFQCRIRLGTIATFASHLLQCACRRRVHISVKYIALLTFLASFFGLVGRTIVAI